MPGSLIYDLVLCMGGLMDPHLTGDEELIGKDDATTTMTTATATATATTSLPLLPLLATSPSSAAGSPIADATVPTTPTSITSGEPSIASESSSTAANELRQRHGGNGATGTSPLGSPRPPVLRSTLSSSTSDADIKSLPSLKMETPPSMGRQRYERHHIRMCIIKCVTHLLLLGLHRSASRPDTFGGDNMYSKDEGAAVLDYILYSRAQNSGWSAHNAHVYKQYIEKCKLTDTRDCMYVIIDCCDCPHNS